MTIQAAFPISHTSCPLCHSRVSVVRGGLVCAGRNFCLWSVDFPAFQPPSYNMGVPRPSASGGDL